MGNKIFDKIQIKSPNSNVFDLTHDVKLSGLMGDLIPILATEALPGDKFQIGCDSLIRFAPLIAPVMHRMDVTMHYFFVPNRILWSNWEDFITGEQVVAAPYITVNGALTAAQNKFLDYMGVPPFGSTTGATATNINALPFAAYQKIYNEYYRDQNLITKVPDTLVDGVNSAADFLVQRNRAWEHDYFTSSLPFAQKGAAVDIPLGDVLLKDQWNIHGTPHLENSAGVVNTGTVTSGTASIDVAGQNRALDPDGTLEVEPTTINDLRTAMRVQEWLEKTARGGSRYIEKIKAFFDVNSSDKRLDRPEYITGVKSPVIVSEVLNTTGEAAGLPQGNMAGHAVSVNAGKAGSYYCEEHGFIIGVMSVMPKTCYQQGINKQFLKLDNLDYYWSTFAHLGEQAVETQEIYAYTPNRNQTFGYLPKYAEYRFIPNRVAGDFRTTLDYWHLGRIFDSEPALNQDFIECWSADLTRIFAVEDGSDNLYMHILNKIKAVRKIPYYGTPTL